MCLACIFARLGKIAKHFLADAGSEPFPGQRGGGAGHRTGRKPEKDGGREARRSPELCADLAG